LVLSFVLAAAFMCSTILGFADAEGLTSLNVFTLAYLVITFESYPYLDIACLL
jgi:hypothetical protein